MSTATAALPPRAPPRRPGPVGEADIRRWAAAMDDLRPLDARRIAEDALSRLGPKDPQRERWGNRQSLANACVLDTTRSVSEAREACPEAWTARHVVG